MWLLPKIYFTVWNQSFRFFTLTYTAGVAVRPWAWVLYDTRSMFDGYNLTHQVLIASTCLKEETA